LLYLPDQNIQAHFSSVEVNFCYILLEQSVVPVHLSNCRDPK